MGGFWGRAGNALFGSFQRPHPEQLTNGTFDTDTDWTLPAEVTISGGKLNFNNITATRTPTIPITSFPIGAVFRVTFTVSGLTSGSVYANIGGIAPVTRTANGTYTQDMTTLVASNLFGFRSTAVGTTLSVDDVSLKRLV
jgi:hypothetical protein